MFPDMDVITFSKLKDIIDYVEHNEISKEYLEKILKLLLPNKNGELLVNYHIVEKGTITALFTPKSKSIILSINQINSWLEKNAHDFMKNLEKEDYYTLRAYLFLFIILHEIEHSYQYLMGEKIITAPSVVLANAYKGLFDLLNHKNPIIPRPIKQTRERLSLLLYKLKENFYVLERNANIESMHIISRCALDNDREDICHLFEDMRDTFIKCGYATSTMGSIEETYRSILMYDKYKKFYEEVSLSEEEKIRYGFGISEKAKTKLFNKCH